MASSTRSSALIPAGLNKSDLSLAATASINGDGAQSEPFSDDAATSSGSSRRLYAADPSMFHRRLTLTPSQDDPDINAIYEIVVCEESGQRLFRCTVCGKEDDRPYSARRHSKVHLKDKRATCSHCSMEFTGPLSLKQHFAETACGPKQKAEERRLKKISAARNKKSTATPSDEQASGASSSSATKTSSRDAPALRDMMVPDALSVWTTPRTTRSSTKISAPTFDEVARKEPEALVETLLEKKTVKKKSNADEVMVPAEIVESAVDLPVSTSRKAPKPVKKEDGVTETVRMEAGDPVSELESKKKTTKRKMIDDDDDEDVPLLTVKKEEVVEPAVEQLVSVAEKVEEKEKPSEDKAIEPMSLRDACMSAIPAASGSKKPAKQRVEDVVIEVTRNEAGADVIPKKRKPSKKKVSEEELREKEQQGQLPEPGLDSKKTAKEKTSADEPPKMVMVNEEVEPAGPSATIGDDTHKVILVKEALEPAPPLESRRTKAAKMKTIAEEAAKMVMVKEEAESDSEQASTSKQASRKMTGSDKLKMVKVKEELDSTPALVSKKPVKLVKKKKGGVIEMQRRVPIDEPAPELPSGTPVRVKMENVRVETASTKKADAVAVELPSTGKKKADAVIVELPSDGKKSGDVIEASRRVEVATPIQPAPLKSKKPAPKRKIDHDAIAAVQFDSSPEQLESKKPAKQTKRMTCDELIMIEAMRMEEAAIASGRFSDGKKSLRRKMGDAPMEVIVKKEVEVPVEIAPEIKKSAKPIEVVVQKEVEAPIETAPEIKKPAKSVKKKKKIKNKVEKVPEETVEDPVPPELEAPAEFELAFESNNNMNGTTLDDDYAMVAASLEEVTAPFEFSFDADETMMMLEGDVDLFGVEPLVARAEDDVKAVEEAMVDEQGVVEDVLKEVVDAVITLSSSEDLTAKTTSYVDVVTVTSDEDVAPPVQQPVVPERRSSRIQQRRAVEEAAWEEEMEGGSGRKSAPPPIYPSNIDKIREAKESQAMLRRACSMNPVATKKQQRPDGASRSTSRRSSRAAGSSSCESVIVTQVTRDDVTREAASRRTGKGGGRARASASNSSSCIEVFSSAVAPPACLQMPSSTMTTPTPMPSQILSCQQSIAGAAASTSATSHYPRLDSLYGQRVHQHQKSIAAPLSSLYPAVLNPILLRTIWNPAWCDRTRLGKDEQRAIAQHGHAHLLLPARLCRTETMVEKCLRALEETSMPLPPLQPLLPAACPLLGDDVAVWADPLSDVLGSLPPIPLECAPAPPHPECSMMITAPSAGEARYTTAFESARQHVVTKSEDRKWWEVRTFPSFGGLQTPGPSRPLPTSFLPAADDRGDLLSYAMADRSTRRHAHKLTYVTSKRPIFAVTESRPLLRPNTIVPFPPPPPGYSTPRLSGYGSPSMATTYGGFGCVAEFRGSRRYQHPPPPYSPTPHPPSPSPSLPLSSPAAAPTPPGPSPRSPTLPTPTTTPTVPYPTVPLEPTVPLQEMAMPPDPAAASDSVVILSGPLKRSATEETPEIVDVQVKRAKTSYAEAYPGRPEDSGEAGPSEGPLMTYDPSPYEYPEQPEQGQPLVDGWTAAEMSMSNCSSVDPPPTGRQEEITVEEDGTTFLVL